MTIEQGLARQPAVRAMTTGVGAVLLACGCQMSGGAGGERVVDQHSYGRPDQVRVRHVGLDLELDFDRRIAAGRATLQLARSPGAATLRLDSLGLAIHQVTGGGVTGGDSARQFSVGSVDPILGAPVEIRLLPEDTRVTVHYATAPDAAALQWLEPEQTAGGAAPFLYTQGQAILTRSWIPLQDSPGVRVTYEAAVRAPAGMRVLMSAEQREQVGPGRFRFRMTKPIPPYLIALACGNLAERAISPRCAVFADPAIIDRAHAEFEDTERMLQACEDLFGAYRWGRYDVLVLPPAFPFGGMENPTLTFATPTILAGDKSLVGLIAHELAHSWSGNLVTNATWRDFWLNEGFTVYLEHRIMESVYGHDRAQMEVLIGMQGLEEELATLPAADQVLHIDLAGRNPDDGMTAVPYDKGAAFLRRLEVEFGRPALDRFLSDYFDEFAFQSMTTARFVEYLEDALLSTAPAVARRVDVRRWVFEPGLPATAPRPQSAAFGQVDEFRASWLAGTADIAATQGWTTHQWLHFVGGLPEDLGLEPLARLDADFAFSDSGNSEILAAWLRVAVRGGFEPALPRLEEFLLRVGRRKFLKPLYEELARTPAGKQRALAIYRRARPRYHAVSRRTLDGILDWSG